MSRKPLMDECVERAGSVPDLVFALAQKGVRFSDSAVYASMGKDGAQSVKKKVLLALGELYFKDDWNEMKKHIRAELENS